MATLLHTHIPCLSKMTGDFLWILPSVRTDRNQHQSQNHRRKKQALTAGCRKQPNCNLMYRFLLSIACMHICRYRHSWVLGYFAETSRHLQKQQCCICSAVTRCCKRLPSESDNQPAADVEEPSIFSHCSHGHPLIESCRLCRPNMLLADK